MGSRPYDVPEKVPTVVSDPTGMIYGQLGGWVSENSLPS